MRKQFGHNDPASDGQKSDKGFDNRRSGQRERWRYLEMNPRGFTFIYVAYGNLDRLYLELRYSLATLLYWTSQNPVDVVIYTDQPDRYSDLPARVIDIAPKIKDFSLNSLYHHRIKPCVLLEEMKTNSNYCVMIDTDTFFQKGFFDKLWSVIQSGSVAMDRFHGRNPFPTLSGLITMLPNAGMYSYDPKKSVEYNSGLMALDPLRHLPVVEDSIALIDAALVQNKTRLTLEQIAFSECLRIHKVEIATMRPFFRHYYRVAHKRYMQLHIRRWQERYGTIFLPRPPTIPYTRTRVRFFRIRSGIKEKLARYKLRLR